jgi:hypothetical protein
MKEYVIKIKGNYDILIINPKMISNLIAKVNQSNTKELIVSADEILPEKYVEYLSRVLKANIETTKALQTINPYELIAKEIEKLQVNNENCFDNVKVTENNENTKFDIDTNEKFYMLVKQKENNFKYVYKNENGEEISVLLEYL